ncbi:myosin-11-like [Tripterygium wilfordii]|uniref:myosin-11-like n=1 Tax=Tripterygium wilfordii TaxID=458696 RepID=UPI0018F80315|nr:myosin-11-like [Tripterygium wilfordii]
MFRSARWRSEKNKIKCVFKLQFHATQVSQLAADALMISVVPMDVGKPTVRSEKVAVQEQCCRWANPVYETVKFFQDPKTGKINEKPYRFMVSTGSSKGGFVGEVSIDFADYAEATKVSTLSLPLKNSKSNIVFHISIQRLQENVDPREVKDCEDTISMPLDKSLRTQLSSGDSDENVKNDFIEDVPLTNTTHHVEVNGDHRTSSGSDITMSSSESSSDLETLREFETRNNNNNQNSTMVLSSLNHASIPQKAATNAPNKFFEENQRTQWEWSGGSDLGMSTDESTNGSQDNIPRERSQPASEFEVERLNSELVALARQVDVSELELQTLRKQVVKETKKGQDLTREVTILKEERDAFKRECEKFKSFQKRTEGAQSKNKLQFEGGDPRAILDEVRQELNYEKDLNANLRLQLQKTQESNAELILAVQDLEDMLEQKNMQSHNVAKRLGSCENTEELSGTGSRSETDDDEEQKALEEVVRGHRDAKETFQLEQKVMDLQSKTQINKRDNKDELEMQMEQLALDYEILKQENHDLAYKLEQSELQEQLKFQYECSSSFANVIELEAQIEKLENELKRQSQQSSNSLATISELESHIESLEEEMEKQAQGFEADLEAVTNTKVEQEQRAIRAEEALRTAKWNNANTAERLQEEFKKLSVQMASSFDANEKVAMKALAEASELRLQKTTFQEMLQKANEELQLVRDVYEAKLCDLSNQLNAKKNHLEQMMLEIDDKSKELEHQRKHEEDIGGAFSKEILGLKAEIETLAKVNAILSEKADQTESLRAELKQMKASIDEAEMLVQRGNVERNELSSTIALAHKEADISLEELNRMKSIKVEREKEVEHLRSELETFKSQCNVLKHSLFEDETEKEKLRKQVFQLKGDLKKKEDAFNSIEKKLKDFNRRTTNADATKITSRNNKSSPVSNGSKEVANLREKMKLLEGQIKLKENALEASVNSFLEKERVLLNKIEELESRVDELRHSSTELCAYEVQKGAEELASVSLNDATTEEVRTTDEYLNSTACKSGENGNAETSINGDDHLSAKPEMNVYASDNRDCNVNELLTELVSLKERNNTVESELKEMQQIYSEISLKFAEVEGERQLLVMTVRNLKNSMKNS